MLDHPFHFLDILGDTQQLTEYLDGTAWQTFLGFGQPRPFQSGETLMTAGAVERVVYIVTDGTLDVVVDAPGANAAIRVDTIEPISVVGEQSFLDGQPRTATVVARTDGHATRLDVDGLSRLTREQPTIAAAFLFDLARVISQRFRAWQ